jgi:uncharacterized protein (DUF1330 family)
MPAYVLIDVDVIDRGAYAEYLKLGDVAAERHGAEFLVRGGNPETLEGGWASRRIAILRFQDGDAARRWYHSAEYLAARQARDGAARFRALLVTGIAQATRISPG